MTDGCMAGVPGLEEIVKWTVCFAHSPVLALCSAHVHAHMEVWLWIGAGGPLGGMLLN